MLNFRCQLVKAIALSKCIVKRKTLLGRRGSLSTEEEERTLAVTVWKNIVIDLLKCLNVLYYISNIFQDTNGTMLANSCTYIK